MSAKNKAKRVHRWLEKQNIEHDITMVRKNYTKAHAIVTDVDEGVEYELPLKQENPIKQPVGIVATRKGRLVTTKPLNEVYKKWKAYTEINSVESSKK